MVIIIIIDVVFISLYVIVLAVAVTVIDVLPSHRAETVEFAGKCVLHLAASSPADLAGKTGRILLSGDLAMEYGFRDVDGDMPAGTRQVNFVLGKVGKISELLNNCKIR